MTENVPAKPSRPNPPRQSARSTPFGVYSRPNDKSISNIEIIAIALSVLWLLGSAIFFLVQPANPNPDAGDSGLRFLMTMLAIFMPVAMIWVAATAARASRVMREESQRLQSAIDAIRQAYIAQQQGKPFDGDASVNRKLDEIAAAPAKPKPRWRRFKPAVMRHPAPQSPCLSLRCLTISPHWPLAPKPAIWPPRCRMTISFGR